MSHVAALNVRELGDFIRDQRHAAQISLRQLAQQAGVSNPYLSQIERGLRKPSAEILQQIAKALRISAEVLYVQAGILEEREGGENVHAAVLADEVLTARQKQVILDIYDAFRRENSAAKDIAGAAAVADALAAVAPSAVEPATETGTRPAPPATETAPGPAATRRRASTAAGRARTPPAGAVADETGAVGQDAGPTTRRATTRRPRAAASPAEPRRRAAPRGKAARAADPAATDPAPAGSASAETDAALSSDTPATGSATAEP